MIPSWYDVLGVDDDATTDEVRAAWQQAVAGLDPTDRRFKQRNRAAEVLLDPARRAAHDRELAVQEDDDWADDERAAPVATAATDVPTSEPVELVKPVEPVETIDTDKPAEPAEDTDEPAEDTDDTTKTDAAAGSPAGRSGRVRLVLGLGVLALVLLVATLTSLVAGGGGTGSASGTGDLPDVRQVEAARKAAETAVGPVLSYDYRDLDKSFAAAKSFMTPHYQGIYDQNVAGYVKENAPTTKTIVTAQVVSSGVVRTGKDRVDVLVFINRPTRNATRDEVSRDQVTVRMLDVDDSWLVDCLVTAPGGTC